MERNEGYASQCATWKSYLNWISDFFIVPALELGKNVCSPSSDITQSSFITPELHPLDLSGLVWDQEEWLPCMNIILQIVYELTKVRTLHILLSTNLQEDLYEVKMDK